MTYHIKLWDLLYKGGSMIENQHWFRFGHT